MKKFFKSLALASIAMAGMLVSSCQIDDIVTAFVPNAAVATIEVTVTDGITGEDVTSQAVITPSSDGNQVVEVNGNILTLKGNQTLSEQNVTVTAKYAGIESSEVVHINQLLAGGVAKYSVNIVVVPVGAAVATINVNVLDGKTGEDITAQAAISAVSSVGQAVEVAGNVLTLKGSNDIAEQDVNVVAKFDGDEGSAKVHVNYLRAGVVAKYAVTLIVGEITPVPPTPVVVTSYACNVVSNEVVAVQTGTFAPSHQAGHSHDGSVWAFNETEFILNAKFMWSAETGNLEVGAMPSEGMREGEFTTLYSFYNALNVDNYKYEEIEVVFPVSAFAMYTALATKTVSAKVYEVVRYETIDGEEQPDVVIGTITVTSVTTQVEPMEAAIPGHEGHYQPGHGHADTHGYSNNAGGGIVWGD